MQKDRQNFSHWGKYSFHNFCPIPNNNRNAWKLLECRDMNRGINGELIVMILNLLYLLGLLLTIQFIFIHILKLHISVAWKRKHFIQLNQSFFNVFFLVNYFEQFFCLIDFFVTQQVFWCFIMINIHQIVTLICDKNQRKSKNYPPVNLWREKKRTNVADQKGNWQPEN